MKEGNVSPVELKSWGRLSWQQALATGCAKVTWAFLLSAGSLGANPRPLLLKLHGLCGCTKSQEGQGSSPS